jgi:hypothetical protein
MALVIIVAVTIGVALLLLLARYAKDPSVLRAEVEARTHPTQHRPEVDPGRLRSIVSELMTSMGLQVSEAEPLERAGAMRLVAVGRGVLRDARHIIYIEASPPGELVEAPTLLALAEDVTHNDASVGVVVTPYRIDRSAVAGLDVDLELIDGPALLALVKEHLPARADEMRRYRQAAPVGRRQGMTATPPVATREPHRQR